MTKSDWWKTVSQYMRTYGWEALYRLLAEECVELAQAALKYIRAVNRETPVSIEEACDNLLEEIADVQSVIDGIVGVDMELGTTTTIDQISDYKQLRMFERLMAKGGEAGVEAQEGLGGGVGEDVPDVRPGAAGF